MNYLHELASVALRSSGNKSFTIQDGHEMTITPAGDGKTMNITIDDGVSCTTKGVREFVKKIESILKGRSVAGWGETPDGQDTLTQVLCMYSGGAVWSNAAPTLRGRG